MNERANSFMVSVLGEDGAQALKKAADRAPELESALLPRTIMSWLGVYRSDFNDKIPGVENTCLKFVRKNERYSGYISIGDGVYCFGEASGLHLGASIAVALGADYDIRPPRDLDIKRLGKNIDLLVKARIAHAELEKAHHPQHSAETPGPAAAPKAPAAPTAPVIPEATQSSKGPTVGVKPAQPKLPKLEGTHQTVQTGSKSKMPKTATLGVTKSQSLVDCPICGQKQFRDDSFSGCICFMGLSKTVRTIKTATGYSLEFGEDWDRESVLTLIESMRAK